VHAGRATLTYGGGSAIRSSDDGLVVQIEPYHKLVKTCGITTEGSNGIQVSLKRGQGD
jgi:hypothetical protein